MKTIDINYENPTRELSTKKYDKIKPIEHTGYDIRYK